MAGEQSTEERVRAYLQPPREEQGSPWVTAAASAAVLGTIAYRRPRAAAVFAGACALMMAPYLGFMVITVNRFGKVRFMVVVASQAPPGEEHGAADSLTLAAGRKQQSAGGSRIASHHQPPPLTARQLLHSHLPPCSLPPS
jgi:hypothetical protein